MAVLDKINELVHKATGTHDKDIAAAFDNIARNVPATTLKDGLVTAFNNSDTPAPKLIATLFDKSNADQKAVLLNRFGATLGPSTANQIASDAGFGNIAPAIGDANLTSQQAAQISAAAVQNFVQTAHDRKLSLVDAAAGFYAQHPDLVKNLGNGPLSLIMAKISPAKK